MVIFISYVNIRSKCGKRLGLAGSWAHREGLVTLLSLVCVSNISL